MKSKENFFGDLYEAPECVVALCPSDNLCADSFGSNTEDYTDGGDFTW